MQQGYKAFNEDMTNCHGIQFAEKSVYEVTGEPIFGTHGNGIHFCGNLEDTFRYFNGLNKNILIAKVIGMGDVLESYDEYYGYYDLYVSNKIYIDYILSRKEIMDYILKKDKISVLRFLMGYKLLDDEINLIIEKFGCYPSIIDTINQYQNKSLTYK